MPELMDGETTELRDRPRNLTYSEMLAVCIVTRVRHGGINLLQSNLVLPGKTSSLNEGSWREFQFVEGTSSKFWKISCSGNEVIECFGKIGTQGQAKPKSFSTPAEAKAHMEKLIAEKTGKGYLEVFN